MRVRWTKTQHRREAESWLIIAKDTVGRRATETALRYAQVHALLALAPEDEAEQYEKWRQWYMDFKDSE